MNAALCTPRQQASHASTEQMQRRESHNLEGRQDGADSALSPESRARSQMVTGVIFPQTEHLYQNLDYFIFSCNRVASFEGGGHFGVVILFLKQVWHGRGRLMSGFGMAQYAQRAHLLSRQVGNHVSQDVSGQDRLISESGSNRFNHHHIRQDRMSVEY